MLFLSGAKEKCTPTVIKIIDLAHSARKQGILALEAEAAQEQDFFLKQGVELVVDGTDPTPEFGKSFKTLSLRMHFTVSSCCGTCW